MAVAQCSYLPKPCSNKIHLSPFSHSPVLSSISATQICSSFNPVRLSMSKSLVSKSHVYRKGRVVSALVSEENAVASSSSDDTDGFKLTYLEGNSWLWDVGGVRQLVDPILVGNLDFGIPWLYDAAKRFLKNFQLTDVPEVDCVLITQSLDDHCHLKTLKPLSEKYPTLRVIATPNAKALLDPLFSNQEDLHSILVSSEKPHGISVQHDALIPLMALWKPVTTLDGSGECKRIIGPDIIGLRNELLSKELPDAQVLEPTPGLPLDVPPLPNLQ